LVAFAKRAALNVARFDVKRVLRQLK
jgi:hypothetical protein